MKQTRITPPAKLTAPIEVTDLGYGHAVWEFSELRAQIRVDGVAVMQFFGETAYTDAIRIGSDMIMERIYA